jgi:hypothetical protein
MPRSHSPKPRSPKTKKIGFKYNLNLVPAKDLVKDITYNIKDENNHKSTGIFIKLEKGKAIFKAVNTQGRIRSLFEGYVRCDYFSCVHFYEVKNKEELLSLEEVKLLPDLREKGFTPETSYYVRITNPNNDNEEIETPFKGTFVLQTDSIKDKALNQYEEGPSTNEGKEYVEAREKWDQYYPGGYEDLYMGKGYIANYFIFENCVNLKSQDTNNNIIYNKAKKLKHIVVDANNSKFYKSYNLQVAEELGKSITGLDYGLIGKFLGGRKRKNITRRKRKFA